MTAPVLMLGYNRPDLSRGLLACVRRASPDRLYVAVDGPRADRTDDAAAVAAVRALSDEVDWPCRVKTLFRDENLGCARGVSEAISWFFGEEPYGIVLEDDIRPSEGFFAYETELLERYRDDPRVGMIAGFSHYGFQSDRRASYHFSNRADIWGWGSWARVWRDYSLDITPYLSRIDSIVEAFTDNPRARRLMREDFAQVVSNPKTWDYQFALMFAAKGYLSAVPRRRLTTNVGLGDARAVHTRGVSYDMTRSREAWAGETPLAHPADVALDRRAVTKEELRRTGIVPHGLDYLGVKCPALRGTFYRLGALAESVCPMAFRV